MKISVLKENVKDETRVALSLESLKKFINLGFKVSIQAGAGLRSNISDADYKDGGASIAKDTKSLLTSVDIVLAINCPNAETIKLMKKGTILIAALNPFDNKTQITALAKAGIISMAMEFMPRITRAQSMDILSSQSNLAGYYAVLLATTNLSKMVPMIMTAAGTVAPAKAFIMGAGVAGLQAIATARRLGAIVSATDVRAAAKEQVESLGADFVMVEADGDDADAETSGGYAKEMSEDYKKRQAELVAQHISKQDIVITTALIPGRPAPKLISKQMVESMKTGAIIVDMAVERGGNCELSKLNKIVDHKGVKIVAIPNLATQIPVDASNLFAKNLYNYIVTLVDQENKKLAIDWEDELVSAITITKDGKVTNEALAK